MVVSYRSCADNVPPAWLGFFLFWLLSLPTIWPPIEKARHFFAAKAIIGPLGVSNFPSRNVACTSAHAIG